MNGHTTERRMYTMLTCLISSKDHVHGSVKITHFICVTCWTAKCVSLACEVEVAKLLQFSIKVLKFESQVSFSTLLTSDQFPITDFESISDKLNEQHPGAIYKYPSHLAP